MCGNWRSLSLVTPFLYAFLYKPRFLIKCEPPCVSFEMKKILWSLTLFGVILTLPVNGVMERLPDSNGTNVYQTENDVYSKAKPTMVELTFVKNANERSACNIFCDPYSHFWILIHNFIRYSIVIIAVCLDGSPSGYHVHPGSGSGAKNWIIQFEVCCSKSLLIYV